MRNYLHFADERQRQRRRCRRQCADSDSLLIDRQPYKCMQFLYVAVAFANGNWQTKRNDKSTYLINLPDFNYTYKFTYFVCNEHNPMNGTDFPARDLLLTRALRVRARDLAFAQIYLESSIQRNTVLQGILFFSWIVEFIVGTIFWSWICTTMPNTMQNKCE